MEKKRKIGIFDSGVGGFSILREVFKLIPGVEVYYIADHAHAPYGEKDADYVEERCEALTDLLLEKQVDLIIMACNTATAIGIDGLRVRVDIPFVGVEPYLNIIHQDFVDQAKVVVLTTELMGKSARFHKLKERLDPESQLDYFGAANLASFIEEAYLIGLNEELISKIQDELSLLKKKGYTHGILGCTHYPLIAEFIAHELGIEVISPCAAVAKRVAELLPHFEPDTEATESFYFMSTQDGKWVQRSQSSLSLPWPAIK